MLLLTPTVAFVAVRMGFAALQGGGVLAAPVSGPAASSLGPGQEATLNDPDASWKGDAPLAVASADPQREFLRQLQTGLIATETRVLDLDDGRVLSLPASLHPNGMNNPRPLLNWMAKEGADLLVTDAGPDLHLHLDDGLLVPLPDKTGFDDAAAVEIERSLEKRGVLGAAQNLSVPKAQTGARSALGFRTREGGLGVLQILGTTERPTGVKLRYRLLRSSNRASPQSVPPRSVSPVPSGRNSGPRAGLPLAGSAPTGGLALGRLAARRLPGRTSGVPQRIESRGCGWWMRLQRSWSANSR